MCGVPCVGKTIPSILPAFASDEELAATNSCGALATFLPPAWHEHTSGVRSHARQVFPRSVTHVAIDRRRGREVAFGEDSERALRRWQGRSLSPNRDGGDSVRAGRYPPGMGFRAAISRCTAKDVADHPRLVEELRGTYPHSITPLERGDERVDCFMFALGIRPFDDIDYLARLQAFDLPSDILGPFCEFLLSAQATSELGRLQASVGDLVLYSRHRRVLHAGRVGPGGRVHSKWGCGWAWDHALWEVPVTYGNKASFARRVPEERLLPAFKLFVWDQKQSSGLPEWFTSEIAPLLRQFGLERTRGGD